MFRPKSPTARARVLSDAEVRALWKACDEIGFPFGPVVKLLLLTGQRRREVAGMRWSELSDDLKATREEKPEHLANGYSPILIECRRKFARWAADLQELPGVTLPPALFNRTGDNWHGLFGIAEAAGGEWPERAKQAAMEEISEEDSNLTLQLLEAIWQIFAEKKVVRMHTKALLDALKKIEEAPWKEANNGREIDGYWLREKLKGFLPRPANPEEAAALRRSREWREGKGPASRATRRTICARPGGATSTERRRPRQPKRKLCGSNSRGAKEVGQTKRGDEVQE